MKRILLGILTITCLLPSADAKLNINIEAVQQSVVFLYRARTDTDPDRTKPLGTGFFVSIPTADAKRTYLVLVTARHIVDPQWAFCDEPARSVIFARINRRQYDPNKDSDGVYYIPIPLISSKGKQYAVGDSQTDAAVIWLR